MQILRLRCLRVRRVMRRAAQPIASERGQGLIELGIIIVMLVTLVMGILEFGRAWLILSVINHAARDGARAAAVTPSSDRDASGNIDSATQTNIGTLVTTEISNAVGAPSFTGASVAVTQPTVSGVPLVTVTVTGTVPYIFNLVGTSVAVDRSVSFRDEGR